MESATRVWPVRDDLQPLPPRKRRAPCGRIFATLAAQAERPDEFIIDGTADAPSVRAMVEREAQIQAIVHFVSALAIAASLISSTSLTLEPGPAELGSAALDRL